METELPEGWEAPPINKFVDLNPKIDKSKIPDDKKVHFVPMPAVEALSNRVDTSEARKFATVKKGYTPFTSNDVLFAKITPCMENGKMVVVPDLEHGLAFGSTEFHVLRPLGDISSNWLFYFVSSQAFRAEAEHNMTGAVGQRRVPIDFIAQHPFPLPPLAEQRSIVTKIEELFSELDAGEQSLKQARQQLGIYRQSLLKQAFEGKLTEAWRKANPDQLEDPDQLLASIQQERETSFFHELNEWESALQEWLDDGETGKKPPKPKKHKVLLSEDVTSFIRFPDAWNSFNLSELVLALRQGWSPKCHNHQASDDIWSVMTTTAIQAGNFIQTANKELPEGLHPRPWITLKLDDILITRAGPRLRCGIVCRVTRTMPKMMLCDKAYRLRFPSAIVSPKFMELLLISPDFSKSIEALKTGINDSGVNITQNGFLQLRASIPSLPEQQEIVRLLEEQFTVIEQNEREIDAALKRSEALRQSILKRAFSGQLVPQDPTDEPASQLLTRIQAERTEQEAKEKATKKAKKKKAKKKTARKRVK